MRSYGFHSAGYFMSTLLYPLCLSQWGQPYMYQGVTRMRASPLYHLSRMYHIFELEELRYSREAFFMRPRMDGSSSA